MKHAVVWLGLAVAAGPADLRADNLDEPPKPVATKPAAAPVVPAVRFFPNPVPFTGASADVVAVAATADGKRVAAAGGSTNPPAGFVTVTDVASKTDLLALKLPRLVNSIAFSPDG